MKYTVGIDEVGRGCLAGPVVVAAAVMPKNLRFRKNGGRPRLQDSKKLLPHDREAWFTHFKNHPHIRYALARVSPRVIDRIDISRAANLAALRAFKKVLPHVPCPMSHVTILLDGGLYLGNKRHETRDMEYRTDTIVHGDEKITAIKIASIIAKVSRDRLMARLAKRFPRYGFEIHKGYGTRAHYAAMRKRGPCEIHRRTFLA